MDIITLENRRESYDSLDKQKRYIQILEVLGNNKMTAKEIAVEMFKRGMIPNSERNFTAPRLTELSYEGIVEPIGKKKCEYTGKTVSVFQLRSEKNGI
jgi:repressor of nif and glnA expression